MAAVAAQLSAEDLTASGSTAKSTWDREMASPNQKPGHNSGVRLGSL